MRYRVLGPVTVIDQGRSVRPGGPKQAALLAVLLLNANRVVAEARLIELIWGDRPPPSVRGRIQVYVSELRKLLGRDVISRRPSGYVIEVGSGELDLDLFDAAVTKARGSGPDAAGQLRYALSLWDGPPLAGVTEALIDSAGPALAERRLAALDELYDLELAAGRHAEAVGELRDAVEQHPLSERLRGHLMLALHRSGRTSEALQVYDETRARLVEELGIDPGQPLQDLRTRILTGEDKPIASAVVQQTGIRPAELPLDVRGFAGRTAELATLNSAPDGIWVISGTAGIGKTALAVHWAHKVRKRFPDGQLYLNLRGFERESTPVAPAAALAQLVRTLGVDPGEMPTELDELARLYRSLLADRKVLVLLDNARDAVQVMPLLPSSGLVLITSRNRLGEVVARAGARSLPLGALPPEDSSALLTAVLGAEAVAAEPEATEQLARLCGHHALALRIAAANVSTTIAGVVAELGKGSSLDQLIVDGADEGAVTAAFALSYQALTPAQQRTFRMLGLIPGPDFTAEATAELTGVDVRQATKQLKVLAAANLVEPYTPDRYRFHDLVRQYASGLVMEDDTRTRTEAWNRLFAYYLAVADAFSRLLGPKIVSLPREPISGRVPDIEFTDVSSGLAWLDPELGNLTEALRYAAAHGPYPMAWYLADSLRRFVHDHGRRAEWLEIAPAVLRAADQRGQEQVAALMHLSLGSAYFREGRHEQGIHHMTQAVEVSRACAWPECEATAVANLSSLMEWTGRLIEAVGHGRQAVLLFRQIDAKPGQCLALNSLGCHYRHLGWLTEAQDCLAEAITLAQAEGLVFWEAAGLADYGHVLLSMGNIADALDALLRSRALFDASGSSYGLAIAFTGLSQVRIAAGNPAQARLDAVSAVELARQDGDKVAEATALIAVGNAQAELEMWRQAEESHRLAVDITTRSGLHWQRAEAIAGLVRSMARLRRIDEAYALAAEALAVAMQGKFVLIEATIRIAIAEVHLVAGRQAEALEQAIAARELWLASGHVTGQQTAQRLLDRLPASQAS
ncbi:DNA-binding SARP family transcriptional activator/DNA-binding MarR family transcriptional regulator [Kibdelosporangium banguiense]|uniref:DNA-binding SARP family transcriptional activator/DNA-binding MarR family transcriptional regulator n=1 Tax=Kibdelosporangium banguiense TaxID=1365924 RepID=A0ABS4U2N4_9PSEU|nr:BTAD domain-containing putative transcriptional regulator [Kibdelosporangium banguiense]MBP2330473.1 DNA-binding SARP family transcriptional activator/DNA-binding MarR family transcriptional regulator [Kibdelosporangium banguiense]